MAENGDRKTPKTPNRWLGLLIGIGGLVLLQGSIYVGSHATAAILIATLGERRAEWVAIAFSAAVLALVGVVVVYMVWSMVRALLRRVSR
jgi:hypothetical protein